MTLADGRVLAVDTLGVQPGRARYFQNVRLTAEADWLCNLAVTWTQATPKQPAELCAIAMNLTADQRTLKDYLKRMHIEQSFRDDKSGSFDLEATKLTEPERLNHLLLAIAVATLWIYDIGEQVMRASDALRNRSGLQASTERFPNRLAQVAPLDHVSKFKACRS